MTFLRINFILIKTSQNFVLSTVYSILVMLRFFVTILLPLKWDQTHSCNAVKQNTCRVAFYMDWDSPLVSLDLFSAEEILAPISIIGWSQVESSCCELSQTHRQKQYYRNNRITCYRTHGFLSTQDLKCNVVYFTVNATKPQSYCM